MNSQCLVQCKTPYGEELRNAFLSVTDPSSDAKHLLVKKIAAPAYERGARAADYMTNTYW
jgi:hypothetical protein